MTQGTLQEFRAAEEKTSEGSQIEKDPASVLPLWRYKVLDYKLVEFGGHTVTIYQALLLALIMGPE